MPHNVATCPSERKPQGCLYTIGYSRREAPDQIERLMQRDGFLLLDIRYSPRSRWYPAFNRAALATTYGERYRFEPRLGNVNYQHRDYAIRLADGHELAAQEAAALLCGGTSLILLCACADPRLCHRTPVAKLIQDAVMARLFPQEVQQ